MAATHEHLIVGAGLSGLSLARSLSDAGREVLVLEKARGLGGRCATRRVDGQPVDHGLPFLHGRSAAFREACLGIGGIAPVVDWPFRVRGEGTPCQPQAYRTGGFRLAFPQGVSALPKHLGRSVPVELESRVEGLSLDGDALVVRATGEARRARLVVVTCPVDQALDLIRPLAPSSEEVAALVETLRTVFTVPCLTVLAGYPRVDGPDFHLWLPGPESPIHSLVNDRSKRAVEADARPTLVIQARPGYSRERLERPEEEWAADLLQAAAVLVGPWARRPAWHQAHRWRFARVQRGGELAGPVLIRFPSGAALGLCGDAFHPDGGAEGAFLSGRALARRILAPADGEA